MSVFKVFYWADNAVNLFFILSGFILCWVYFIDEKTINWKRYIISRIARITPLYYLTTILLLPSILYSLFKYGTLYLGDEFYLKLFLNLTLISGYTLGPPNTFNGPAWSICVEIFLYILIFPLCVYFANKVKKVKITLIIIFSITGLISCYIDWMPKSFFGWNYTWLFRGIYGFVAGFFICQLFCINTKVLSSIKIDLIIILSIVIFILTRKLLIPEYILIIAMPFLIYYTAFDKGYLCFLLRNPSLQWLGDRSYSIYLWHWPILLLCKFLSSVYPEYLITNINWSGYVIVIIVSAIVLYISNISYVFFEMPMRRLISASVNRK